MGMRKSVRPVFEMIDVWNRPAVAREGVPGTPRLLSDVVGSSSVGDIGEEAAGPFADGLYPCSSAAKPLPSFLLRVSVEAGPKVP